MGKAAEGSNNALHCWSSYDGRSRGGFTSTIHALVDAEGRPVHLRLTAGQVADCIEVDALTKDLGERAIPLAGKGYDSNAVRTKAA